MVTRCFIKQVSSSFLFKRRPGAGLKIGTMVQGFHTKQQQNGVSVSREGKCQPKYLIVIDSQVMFNFFFHNKQMSTKISTFFSVSVRISNICK